MLTENQQIKLQKIKELYFKEAIKEIDENKLIEILRKNNWHMSESLHEIINCHNEIIKEKNRIANLPKNIVKPSDEWGYDELWLKFYNCPNCGHRSLTEHKEKYCHECGIEVDWSEIK